MDILSLNKVNKLNKEFNNLNNDYNNFKVRLDFIKGVVATESELPPSSNDGDVFFVKNSNKLVKYDILTNGYVDLSSSGGGSGSIQEVVDARNGYPTLKTRLDVLESQFAQDVKIYTEEFNNNPLVDTEKTTAIVGRGYVKVGKTATVVEEFNDTTKIDLVNSTNIKVENGKAIINNALNGILVSNEFTTAGTDYAIINPVVNHYSDMAFSNVNNVANRIANSQSLVSTVVVDRLNRIWYFYGGSGGLIYCKVFNPDGTIAINEFSITGTAIAYGTYNIVPKAVVDYNNRIWLFYGNGSLYPCVVVLNPDGTIFKAVEVIINYITYKIDAFVDRNNRIWVMYNDVNANLTKFKIYNADGSVFVAPVSTGFISYSVNIIYDSARDKIILLGNNSSVVSGTICNLDGTIYKTATTIISNGHSSDTRAFYDESIDKIVVFTLHSSTLVLMMLLVDPVTLSVSYKRLFPNNEINIAKYMAGISVSSTGAGNKSYLIDSSATDGWASVSGNPNAEWVKFDLGEVYNLKRFNILNSYTTTVYSTGYTIAVSLDGINFTDVATVSGLTGQVWTNTVLDNIVKARYVKIYKFTSTNTYAYLGEVEIYTDDSEAIVKLTNNYTPMSAINENNVYKIAFVSNKESATYTNIHYCEIRNNGALVRGDTSITSDGAYHDNFPTIYKHPDGTLRVLYSSARNSNYFIIDEAIYTLTPTQAIYKLSNDGGLTWLTATPGQQVNFPSRNNRLKVRIELQTPYPNMTPELLSYTVQEWSSDGSGAIIGEFVTTTLPTTEPAVKFTLTANQLLNGGTIDWYISNDGGATWIPVTLGQQTAFPNPINADVRIKAIINSPMGQAQSPIITEYKLITSSTVMFSDFNNLQINLMKTNFKLDSFANASRNAMKNLIVDTFNDETGINISKSVYTFDNIKKCVKNGTVVSVEENLSVPPNYVLLTVDEKLNSGSITYYVSRDGGTTWTQINPNVKTDISGQPNGIKLVMKAVITGDAELSAWAYAWS